LKFDSYDAIARVIAETVPGKAEEIAKRIGVHMKEVRKRRQRPAG
jgi:hypothetical protein